MGGAQGPTDPREKRLAIPSGEYGGGRVIVWDTGTHRNETGLRGKEVPVADAAEGGHVTVWLHGEKLRGGYALTRTGRAGDRERWILVKKSDGEPDARRNPMGSQPANESDAINTSRVGTSPVAPKDKEFARAWFSLRAVRSSPDRVGGVSPRRRNPVPCPAPQESDSSRG